MSQTRSRDQTRPASSTCTCQGETRHAVPRIPSKHLLVPCLHHVGLGQSPIQAAHGPWHAVLLSHVESFLQQEDPAPPSLHTPASQPSAACAVPQASDGAEESNVKLEMNLEAREKQGPVAHAGAHVNGKDTRTFSGTHLITCMQVGPRRSYPCIRVIFFLNILLLSSQACLASLYACVCFMFQHLVSSASVYAESPFCECKVASLPSRVFEPFAYAAHMRFPYAGESSQSVSNSDAHSSQGQNGTAEVSSAPSFRASGESQAAAPRHDTVQASSLTPSQRPASTPAQTPTQAQTPAQPSSGRSTRTHARSASNKLTESGASAPTTRSAAHHAHLAAQKDSAHLMHGLHASEAQAAVAALAMLHSSPHRLCTTPSKDPVASPASTLFVPSTGPLLVRSDGTTVQLDPSMLERIMTPSNAGFHYDWARVVQAGPPAASAQQQSQNSAPPFIQVLSNADAQAIAALQELGAGHGDSSSARSNAAGGLGMARVLTAVPGSVAGSAYVRTFFAFLPMHICACAFVRVLDMANVG